MMPRKGLNTESKISACNGAFSSPSGGNAGHDGFQHLFDARSRLSRREQNIFVLASYEVDHLIFHLVDHRRIHVDLVQYG